MKINKSKIKAANKSKKELAASLVEYGLLVALISVIAMGAVKMFGESVSASFSYSTSALTL